CTIRIVPTGSSRLAVLGMRAKSRAPRPEANPPSELVPSSRQSAEPDLQSTTESRIGTLLFGSLKIASESSSLKPRTVDTPGVATCAQSETRRIHVTAAPCGE